MRAPPEFVLATSNPGKLREFQELLGDQSLSLRVATPDELAALPEEGTEYQANAIEKARCVALASGCPTLADDSGLEVEGLAGAPGPLSARYGGAELDDRGRVRHLLENLSATPGLSRSAQFVCVAALALPDGEVTISRGECPGVILDEPEGQAGFGYDPIFRPGGHTQSMAELSAATKNSISHRGRALAGLATALRAVTGEG